MKRKLMLVSLIGLLLLGLTVPVHAQNTPAAVTSGGRATDYQPPTDNPQSDVSTGLQNTSSGLQPVPGQIDLSQQNLSGQPNLQVAGTQGAPNPNTTSTAPVPKKRINLLPHIIIGILVLGTIYYIVTSGDDAAKKKKPTATETKPEPLPTVRPKTKKKAVKKKATKKRKK